MADALSFIADMADMVLAIGRAHGAVIMLSLLASRWLISIIGMMRSADPGGRALWFNAIAFAAYLAGALQFSAEHGRDWIGETAGLFFALNLALILIDAALIFDLRRMGNRVHRRLRIGKTP